MNGKYVFLVNNNNYNTYIFMIIFFYHKFKILIN